MKQFLLSIADRLHAALFGFLARQGLILGAVQLPNGATVAVGTMAAAKTMSALSNASEAVATLEASHGVVENDILVLNSGWPELNGRVVRADSVSTNDVTLEDIDTSSTTTYPAGTGTGSVREVSSWTNISQILEFSTNGGEQQFVTYSFLNESVEHQIPTVKSAQSFSLVVGDDQSLAHYSVLAAADYARTAYPIRITLPSGALIYANAYVTLNKTPTLTKNEVMGLRVTMSLVAEVTRYAS